MPGIGEPLANVLNRLEGVKQNGQGYMARCPAHGDRTPSLHLSEKADGTVLIKCHAGCSTEEVVQSLGLKLCDLFPATRQNRIVRYTKGEAEKQKRRLQELITKGLTLAQYAQAKQLPMEFLIGIGVSERKYEGKPALRFSYRGTDGSEVSVRYRIALVGDRFRWKRGDKPLMYGLCRLTEKPAQLVLVEGESDCHTLWHHGIPGLGIPGAANFKEERDAQHLDGVDRIYVVVEADEGGEAVKKWLAKSRIRDRTFLLDLSPFKDPSEMHCSDPDQFKDRFKAAMRKAVRFADVLDHDRAKAREDASAACKGLATLPSILDAFAQTYGACGAVGEVRIAKILYLALTTRFLDRPVSVAVKGPSSGGKSFTTETVIKFFPPEATYILTAMSERLMAYTDADLKHRFLVVYEAAGMAGEMASYLIRSLLSEGRLVYEFVDKTSEGLKPRRIEKEGPTGLLVTTTAVRLHSENETRLLSVNVTDTREQTKAILKALAKGASQSVDLTPWIALQRWIAHAEHRVTVPYADALAELIPPVAVRLRRDFSSILNLIKGHAILHQASRKKDGNGRIVATPDDYAAVRDLVADIVSEGIETMVPKTIRETVDAVDALSADHPDGVSVTTLSTYLKLDKSAMSRRTAAAIDRSYLKNEEDRKGRPARLKLGDRIPKELDVLPTVEVLQRCSVAAGGNGKQKLRFKPKRRLKLKKPSHGNVK